MVHLGDDGVRGKGKESREEKEGYKSVLSAIVLGNYGSVLLWISEIFHTIQLRVVSPKGPSTFSHGWFRATSGTWLAQPFVQAECTPVARRSPQAKGILCLEW